MPKILSGPYGSLIHDKLTKEGASDRERAALTDPRAILYKPRVKKMVRDIARSYRDKGVDVLTPNTFYSREILKGNDQHLYPYVVRQHLHVLQELAHARNEIAVSFGPYGNTSKPEQRPKNIREAQDFWEAAFEPLLFSSGKVDYALAETVDNQIEAIAIVKAWQKIQKFRGKIQGVVSFIPQKDGVHLLSGERIVDVINALYREVGTIPVLLGLNCCAISALEPTLRDVLDDRDASRRGAQFRFIYPNASDAPVEELEQSPENQVSRTPDVVGKILFDVISKYERSLPGVANHVIINECCGGTPERTSIIAQQVKVRTPEIPVS